MEKEAVHALCAAALANVRSAGKAAAPPGILSEGEESIVTSSESDTLESSSADQSEEDSEDSEDPSEPIGGEGRLSGGEKVERVLAALPPHSLQRQGAR